MQKDPDLTLPFDPSSGTPRFGRSHGKAKGWQPPTIEELQALLPQYEITKLLGRGGMGAVYQGTQVNLDRPVAIKIRPPGMEADNGANFTERFKNEARAMARLSHPGIVAVYDFGETSDGILYIVMEFIEGTDVQKMVLEQGRLHSAYAMAVTAHVCDALQYAHDRKIIHRDIKPANIMVGYDGGVKVADFGLAKMSMTEESALTTRSGISMGTLHYMAPEALMLGSNVDHRADIYAVGVMLYYMLTGKLPQGMFELPSLQVSGLDPRLDRIIAKALRDDREIRYQSVTELRKDLDGILTQPVLKVNSDAEASPSAQPTAGPPQVHGLPPAPANRVQVRVEKSNSPLLWAAVILLGGFVAWTQLKKPPAPEAKPVVTESPTATIKAGPAKEVFDTLPTAGWLPMITDKAAFQKQPGVTSLPNGWWKLEKIAIPLGKARNVILRCKLQKMEKSTQAVMPLRWNIEPNGNQSNLRAFIMRNASMTIQKAWTDLQQPGWSSLTIDDHPVIQLLDSAEHEFAFAAMGDTISTYLDGKFVSSVRDSTCLGENFGLHAISPATIKDPEWLALDEQGHVLSADSIEEIKLRQR